MRERVQVQRSQPSLLHEGNAEKEGFKGIKLKNNILKV